MLSESELFRLNAMSLCEKRLRAEGFSRIAGIDEAGRGPLAGPVVAAACILPPDALFPSLNDSKQLTPHQRDALFSQITTHPDVLYGIGIVEAEVIDRINILQATFLAMQKAVHSLPHVPDYLLIDGNQLPHFDIPTEALIEGDGLSISIAAASVLAKVTRDRILDQLHIQWPQYGFNRHKGYATRAHLSAITLHGPCPIHRRTFAPLKPPLPTQPELF